MKPPQVGWTVAAPLVEVEESPHSKERDAGETPGRSNLPDRATENKQPPVREVMVKRWCKRPPASVAMRAAR